MPGTLPLVLLGAGGTAREVVDLVAALSRHEPPRYRIVAGLDDRGDAARGGLGSIPVEGPLRMARDYPADTWFVDTLGSSRNYRGRPGVIGALGIPDSRFATLLHPSAVVSASARIGAGSLIFAHATIGAGATLGAHVSVLPHCSISHDAEVGDWSLLATGAIVSGAARVGQCCYLGAGAVLIERSRVGDAALVGMGSVVLTEVAAGTVVAGNPARVLRPVEGG